MVCDECMFAASEVRETIENPENQRKVRDYISTEVCSKLRKYRGTVSFIFLQHIEKICSFAVSFV